MLVETKPLGPVMGQQRPRLASIPEYSRTLGPEAIELADIAGLHLDDWQQWSITNSLGIRDDYKWSAFETCLIVARQNGKTAIIEARELAGLFLLNETLIIHTAHEYRTAEESFRRLCFWIQNTPDLDSQVAHIRTAAGEQAIELKKRPTTILPDGSILPGDDTFRRVRFIARSRTSGRGFTGDTLIWDEAMVLDAGMVGSTLPTLLARPNPQVWYCASAGMGKKSTQLAYIRRRVLDPKIQSPRLFFGEWSVDPHNEYCSPDCAEHDDIINPSPRVVGKANPALGSRISLENIESARESMAGQPGEFERECLCIGEYPAPTDAWLVIQKEWWKACASSDTPMLSRVVFAVDTNLERSYSSIAVAGMRPDGLVGIELVEFKSGTKWLVPACKDLHEQFPNAKFIIDPRSGAATVMSDLIDAGIKVETMSAHDVAVGCGYFFDAVRDNEIVHLDDKRLADALAGADKRPLSDAWAWDRKNSGSEISPVIVVTNAFWGYRTYNGADVNMRDTVHYDSTEIVRLCREGFYSPADIARLREAGILESSDEQSLEEAGFGAWL